jgi:hypothetical protein
MGGGRAGAPGAYRAVAMVAPAALRAAFGRGSQRWAGSCPVLLPNRFAAGPGTDSTGGNDSCDLG